PSPEAVLAGDRRRGAEVLVCDLDPHEAACVDLMRTIRAEADAAPLVAIAVGARPDEAERLDRLAAGFDVFLSRPVEARTLVAEIQPRLQRFRPVR
ncbi:MAG: hypothetical protein ACRD2J_08775, partial [Thermoanaerobaculia bacterium]